jgi:pimeloyl-ACP methyl ester carboxylesterase
LLSQPPVNLDSHIDDVADILKRENLHGATLVGHSYAGMVITGVAERESGRLSRLIYVDAFVPDNGESALDLLPEPIQKSFREEARANEKGWRLPASESLLDLRGLQPGAAREYVRTRLCDFSLRCFEQKIRSPSNAAAMIQRRSLQLSPRATRRDSSLNDSGQGRAVSIGIITSCPPAMIAIWKPLRDLFLPC